MGSFAEALRGGSVRELASFAKADRHCHSIFGASFASIEQWTGKRLPPPPARMAGFDAMRLYAHGELYPYIYNRNGFEFTAERAILEAASDGVDILEMSFDVNFIQYYGNGVDGFLAFIHGITARHRGALHVSPEIGVSKNRAPETQIELARACVDSGIFESIDLYGNENAQEPEVYQALYRHAASEGLKLKAHAGEFDDAGHVERTLRALELDEIQHGVAAASSQALMRLLKAEDIRLNVCPSSNVALSVAEDLAHHPVRILARNGVRVSINSDDKTIFGKTVSEEYLGLYQAGTLDAEELDSIRRDSLVD